MKTNYSLTPKSTKEILDEEHEKILKSWSRNSSPINKFLFIFKPLHSYLIRFFIFVFFIFVFLIIFRAIIAAPKYSELETQKNADRLDSLILSKTGSSIPLFKPTLEYLKKYPKYYDKVVNNIVDIELKNNICPYACIYYYTNHSINNGMINILIPEANLEKKTLIINSRGINHYNTVNKFASMLIHETDHVEYIESGKLRRMGLFFKCNPLLNPHISINSTLPSISHRLKTIEICAEKEQIEFHKFTGTDSGYETKNGILNIFLKSSQMIFLNIYYFFKSFF